MLSQNVKSLWRDMEKGFLFGTLFKQSLPLLARPGPSWLQAPPNSWLLQAPLGPSWLILGAPGSQKGRRTIRLSPHAAPWKEPATRLVFVVPIKFLIKDSGIGLLPSDKCFNSFVRV